MNKEQKYSCASELGAEIFMVITSFFIVILSASSVYANTKFQVRIISEQSFSLILPSLYALFLPLMSFMFSQVNQYYPEGRAQQILIWMVLIEYVHIHGEPFFTWELRKSAEQLVRLFWVGFLVSSYAPLQGIRVSLLSLCILFAIIEVLKGININKAKDSYLIGKNTKVIHNYVKRVVVEDDLKTTPLNSCDYIVMGENYNEIDVCYNGYILGEKKPKSELGMVTVGKFFELITNVIDIRCNGYLLGKQKSTPKLGMVTVGSVFQLTNSSENKAHGCSWRETCLSFALAKMLRRRFAKLPVDEAGSGKALNFVLEGLIDYIGNHRDIQTDGNDGEIRNPMERVFCIIKQELKFVSEFSHMKVPAYYYNRWYTLVEIIGLYIVLGNGVYLIIYTIKTSSKWFSLGVGVKEAYNQCFFHYFRSGSVAVKILSRLDLAITILLVAACAYVQMGSLFSTVNSKGWRTVGDIEEYINVKHRDKRATIHHRFTIMVAFYLTKLEECVEICFGTKMLQKLKLQKPRSIFSVFEEHPRICFIIACLPKCIRKAPRFFPTVICPYVAKEAVLMSLTNSGGILTNGEISQKKYEMFESLKWACQPNGSTTEAILVWHIATTLFHHQETSPQQNNNPFTKEQAVVLELSTYCLYLVVWHPELLPDEVKWTEKKCESVWKDIFAIFRSFDQIPTENNLCNYVYALETNTWSDNSLVGKGAKLANDLIKYAKEGYQVWKMLAEFWPEMMLYIAPSDYVEGHQKILHKGEFITELWALLTHAGIVTRPTPTEHQDHKGESNAVPREASNEVLGDESNAAPAGEINTIPGDDSNAVRGGEINNAVPGDENV